MAELADALVSGTSEGSFMQVQVLFLAPIKTTVFDTKPVVFLFIQKPLFQSVSMILAQNVITTVRI